MEENNALPPDPQPHDSQPRRFVYRAAQPDSQPSHPMRRSTDTPQAFQGTSGQLCPQALLLKFRVYLKVN